MSIPSERAGICSPRRDLPHSTTLASNRLTPKRCSTAISWARWPEHQGHEALLIAEVIGARHIEASRYESTCASAGAAVRQGVKTVRNGEAVVVVVGGADFAEVHDCVTIAEFLATEALGFFKTDE